MGIPEYLVVDMDRVLNESEHGRTGLESMQALLRRAQSDAEALKADVQKTSGPAAQKTARDALMAQRARVERELDQRRSALRDALIKLATKVTRNIAAERGVELVLERRSALVFNADNEVTDAVIAGLDASQIAAGPKSKKPEA